MKEKEEKVEETEKKGRTRMWEKRRKVEMGKDEREKVGWGVAKKERRGKGKIELKMAKGREGGEEAGKITDN